MPYTRTKQNSENGLRSEGGFRTSITSFLLLAGLLRSTYPNAIVPRCISTSSQYLPLHPLNPNPLPSLNLPIFLKLAPTLFTTPPPMGVSNTQQPNFFPLQNGSLFTRPMKYFSFPPNTFFCISSPLSSLLRLQPYSTPLQTTLHPASSTFLPSTDSEKP